MLVDQPADRIVDVKATEPRQIRAEHAFFDGRHREGVDRRMIIQVTGHVDGHQAVVWHRQQLSRSNLCHLAALGLRPTDVLTIEPYNLDQVS